MTPRSQPENQRVHLKTVIPGPKSVALRAKSAATSIPP